MRKRRETDEVEVTDLPPEPNYPTWTDADGEVPEWCVEVWVDGRQWFAILWQLRDDGRVQRGDARHAQSKQQAVDVMVAAYRRIMATEASRTFYVMSDDIPEPHLLREPPPDPAEEDWGSLH